MADFGVKLFDFDKRSWTRPKDQADFDYWGVDWSGAWLGITALSSVVWIIPVASGLVTSDEHIEGAISNIKLSGGNIGEWEIKVAVTTNDSRTRSETFILRIE